MAADNQVRLVCHPISSVERVTRRKIATANSNTTHLNHPDRGGASGRLVLDEAPDGDCTQLQVIRHGEQDDLTWETMT
jgi:hypothetical protein